MSKFRMCVAATVLSAGFAVTVPAHAETLFGALAKAYEFNSTLNSARAGVRVSDENVPIAKSGYRPTLSATSNIARTQTPVAGITTGSFGITLSQTLFDGFQTRNNVRAAEAQVRAANEGLRNTEQNTLLDGVTAFMDVIRDRQIAVLTERNLQFLEEQVRAARSRFDVGEGTRTDVAQADASRALAIAQLNAARAQARSSEAVYRQIVGEDPGRLRAAGPAKGLPGGLGEAFAVASAEHPAILANLHLVDAAGFTVKSSEGALLPRLSAQAGVSTDYTEGSPLPSSNGWDRSASIGATLTVPLYQGGRASAVVRQSKESLGQSRIEVDVSRDQVRAAVSFAWSQYQASRETVIANRELVSAANLALSGVIEERNVGQRTTLNVLDAQADVITAQINQVSSERDLVVASYAIKAAIGRLSAGRLGLQVTEYKPKEHYKAVKDKWIGLRTPDGR